MGSDRHLRFCAFVTMADRSGHVIDDELAVAPLAALGWRVETVPWDRPGVRWGDYEVVVLRSPWDYYQRPQAFDAVLGDIARSGARLENDLELVRWNLAKSYLRELAARGVPMPPTRFLPRLERGVLQGLFATLGAEEIVLKPQVGANAEGAFRLDRRQARRRRDEIEACYAERPLLAQAFARRVVAEGEISLVYFDGDLSHAVSKTPRRGDFRAQEEHGGEVRAVAADETVLAAGRRALAALAKTPLYARVDLVRSDRGDDYWLLELEVAEPSLYLRMDPAAPERFARALDARHRRDRR